MSDQDLKTGNTTRISPDTNATAGQSILIIEDSLLTQRLLAAILRPQGYELHFASSGEEGVRRFAETQPDLVLLDVILPGIDGFEVCRRLLAHSNVLIIFLSTMADEDAIVRALEAGAFDYVEKPFSAKVLLARVRTALRQRVMVRPIVSLPNAAPRPTPPSDYDDGYLSINLEQRRVSVGGKAVKLTATEFNLLAYLFMNAGQTLTIEQILQHVWGWEDGDTSSVYTYVRRLRSKLEPDAESPRYITVMHGVGYCFEKR